VDGGDDGFLEGLSAVRVEGSVRDDIRNALLYALGSLRWSNEGMAPMEEIRAGAIQGDLSPRRRALLEAVLRL